MSVLSKLLFFEYNLPYSCYELGHTWCNSCSEAALDIGSSCLRESTKIYFPLFLITQLINNRHDLKSFKQTISNVAQSSLFLSLNAYLGMLFFCWFRHIFGKFYYILSCWPPSFLASFIAIQLERPSRRGPLALYTLNLALQTLINNLVDKKYLPNIRNFHVIVFTLSIATQFYLMKKNGYSNDLFSSVIKFFLGETEIQSKSLIEKNRYRYDLYQSTNNHLNNNSILNDLLFDKHRSCIHKDNCSIYVLKGFLRPFLITTIFQLSSKLLLKPKQIFNNPSILIDEIKKSSNYKLGLFTSLFSSVFKLTNCLLRRKSDGRKDYHVFISALLSGPLIFLNPSSSIAMYVFCKGLESIYNDAVNKKLIKHHNVYSSLVYSLATAQIFYTAIVEPEYMKPSYLKFVNRVTDDRINLFNRPLFKGFFNNLDDEYIIKKALEEPRKVLPEYTSRYYKENISTWLNE